MITIDHLTKRYGTVTAIGDLSFEVGPGRVTGFLGPNGAGKTTTLRILLGLAAPTSGTATISGNLSRPARRRQLEPDDELGDVLQPQCHLAKFDLGGGVSLRGVLPGGRQDHLAWQTMAW
jgi:ABC-type multidrug transport system ATPase subunit